MNFRYILILAVVLIPFIYSCNDDDKDEYQKETVNIQRVKEINGHNDHWGDFKMECSYTDHFLDSAIVTDAAGKRIGIIQSTYGIENTLDVFDLVKSDESDVLIRRRIFSKSYVKNDEGKVIETTEHYYGPSENLQEGAFDFYEEKKTVRNIFEYDEMGRMIVCRCPDPLHKQMLYYDGLRIISVEHYNIANGEWNLAGEEKYIYQNKKLSSISFIMGNEEVSTWKYNWNADQLASLDVASQNGNETRTFTYDAQGFVTSMTIGDENLKIIYERGNGNFGMFSSFFESFRGVPCIR